MKMVPHLRVEPGAVLPPNPLPKGAGRRLLQLLKEEREPIWAR